MRAYIVLFLLTLGSQAWAQERIISNEEISFTLGIAELEVSTYPTNQDLDFLNYVDHYPSQLDFILIKLGYRFDLYSKISTDIKLVMLDDIIPDNYDVSAYYNLNPWLGLGLGSMLSKNWISNFEEYQIQALPEYYLVNDNLKQFNTYELGFYISPKLRPIRSKYFSLQVSCDLGMSSFSQHRVSFLHKKQFSNEKVRYQYQTHTHYQPYIQPKMDIRIHAFSIKEASFGFLFNSTYYHSNRSINYTRTTTTWTSENPIAEHIQAPKHTYARLEVNMGMCITW
ncbi:hypothetical protein QWY31_10125 [Cytophagales bacterium LB-30]|uniref:Outer membrane protein beta-barrel domain-containing protein n=1 Tax=Shiella aurantiaca TaxID=3058365 RepID=A0ABT8F5X1_9BACT|nr:hypothetical protein [Shiella aurantiaca]MDN4165862.1 hypothetical protein [Shiella aurantiaca]